MDSVDWSNVKVLTDRVPPEYTTEDTITITVSGQVTVGEVTREEWGPFDIPVVSESGVGNLIHHPGIGVTRGELLKENVLIDALAGAVLTLAGKAFTVSDDCTRLMAVA